MKTGDFTCDAEVRALVSAFEAGALPLADFKHAAHLAVALAYLEESPLPEATGRMRAGLRHFLARHGQTGGYHETLTVFWMGLLDHLAAARCAGWPLWRRVNGIVGSHGSGWPVSAHYSRERVTSEDARRQWVAPDLRPLPF